MKTEDILNEREKTHGDFERVARRAHLMQVVLALPPDLDSCKKISIQMILLKIARIACGDPDFADHWDDIAGYAMLGKGKDEPTEFEKEYLTPFGEGEVHFWQEGATRQKEAP